jgi:hypothetical protein
MVKKIKVTQFIFSSSQRGDLSEKEVSLFEDQLNDFLEKKSLSLEDVRITHNYKKENVNFCGIVKGSQIYTLFYYAEREKRPFKRVLQELLSYKLF